MSASQDKQNAWALRMRFTSVTETEEYAKLNFVDKFRHYGHLLNGAGLAFISSIQNETSRAVTEEGIFEVLKNVTISSIRVCMYYSKSQKCISCSSGLSYVGNDEAREPSGNLREAIKGP